MNTDPHRWSKLNFWVLGGAKSGIAAAILLKNHGATVFLSDSGPLPTDARNALQANHIEFEENGHNLEALVEQCDVIVLSPAILLSSPLALIARDHGIPIVSEIEVANWFLPQNALVIAITGTNGKSTTTHYTAQLLRQAGFKANACGNIGVAFSQAVCDVLLEHESPSTNRTQPHFFVVELSSYQLETTHSLQPMVSIFLNIQEDHLQRYQHIDEYLKAKWRMVVSTRKDGLAIIERGVLEMALRMGLELPCCEILVIGISHQVPIDLEQHALATVDENLRERVQRNRKKQQTAKILAERLAKVQKASKKANFADVFFRLPRSIYQELHIPNKNSESIDFFSAYLFTEIEITRTSERNHEAIDVNVIYHNPLPVHPACGTTALENFFEGTESIAITNPVLPGMHNAFNICVGTFSALALGVAKKTALEMWAKESSSYAHLAHRLEFCGEIKSRQILFYNDSKATNVESTLVALSSFKQNVLLLVGGEPKGESFSRLLSCSSVTKFFPFGKAHRQLCNELNSSNKVHMHKELLDGNSFHDTTLVSSTPSGAHPTMLQAAEAALNFAKEGSLILLSPACASFDEFRNFEHRGDIFKQWVAQKI